MTRYKPASFNSLIEHLLDQADSWVKDGELLSGRADGRALNRAYGLISWAATLELDPAHYQRLNKLRSRVFAAWATNFGHTPAPYDGDEFDEEEW